MGATTESHSIKLQKNAYEQLLDLCRRKLPEEACGVLVRSGDSSSIDSVIPIPNVHPNPRFNFSFDPAAWTQIFFTTQKNRQQLVGFYHSHPGSRAVPSSRDIEGFIFTPELTYWIISFEQIDAPAAQPYRWLNGRFEPLQLVLA